MMHFDPSDKPLITELAKTMTPIELAEKWECTPVQMRNYLYRNGIKAVSACAGYRPNPEKKAARHKQRVKMINEAKRKAEQDGISVSMAALILHGWSYQLTSQWRKKFSSK
jgi:hypothetical protein